MNQQMVISDIQTDLEKYAKLLMKRDALKKEAKDILIRYIQVFGDLIASVFEKKILCIEKKKAISFCQILANRGMEISADELQEHLEKVMQSYNEQLEGMKQDAESAAKAEEVPLYQESKIKQIYRKLAKALHPDLHPEMEKSEELMDLWDNIQMAYVNNDLKGIEELEIIAGTMTQQIREMSKLIRPDDIEKRIRRVHEEINQIITTDPYQYRYILEDVMVREERIRELKEQEMEYEAYAKELNKVLAKFDIRETKSCLVS